MSGKLNLHIEKPGLYTTLQDMGRLGYQDQGIPLGGALDRSAYHLANALVGNEATEPVLELTLMGPQIFFEGFGLIAITGADLSPRLNGNAVQNGEALVVMSGDRLSFGKAEKGCRAYLAVRGYWSVDKWKGSVSPLAGVGFSSGPLKSGDVLTVQTSIDRDRKALEESTDSVIEEISLLPGPESGVLDHAVKALLVKPHKVSNNSNRMGLHLDSELPGGGELEIISSPVFPGVIQLTHSGQPIILLADAQTTGGYPRIAVVDAGSMDLLAQKKPGDELRFRLLD